jgi:hypothetical protein
VVTFPCYAIVRSWSETLKIVAMHALKKGLPEGSERNRRFVILSIESLDAAAFPTYWKEVSCARQLHTRTRMGALRARQLCGQ